MEEADKIIIIMLMQQQQFKIQGIRAAKDDDCACGKRQKAVQDKLQALEPSLVERSHGTQ